MAAQTGTDASEAEHAAEKALELLERLLDGTTLRAIKGARPIAFVLDGAPFVLDPHAKPLMRRGTHPDAALTMRTSTAVLVRLLTAPNMFLGQDEELAIDGDPRALKPLVDALAGGKSPLQTRLGALAR
jgi:hypothetical protein